MAVYGTKKRETISRDECDIFLEEVDYDGSTSWEWVVYDTQTEMNVDEGRGCDKHAALETAHEVVDEAIQGDYD